MASSAPRCSHCGKQRATLKRCSVCKQASYCGAACQNAGWKKHEKTCAPPLSTNDVWANVIAADAAGDWRAVLEWEGRMEEKMEGQSDDARNALLCTFIRAHHKAASGLGLGPLSGLDFRHHALSEARLVERRVELLGRMERFRDQGDEMCALALNLEILGRREEAAKQYARARAVGAVHGFFSVECAACEGLGKLEIAAGRGEEGLALMRNALVASRLSENDNNDLELSCVGSLIPALLATNALDEVPPSCGAVTG